MGDWRVPTELVAVCMGGRGPSIVGQRFPLGILCSAVRWQLILPLPTIGNRSGRENSSGASPGAGDRAH